MKGSFLSNHMTEVWWAQKWKPRLFCIRQHLIRKRWSFALSSNHFSERCFRDISLEKKKLLRLSWGANLIFNSVGPEILCGIRSKIKKRKLTKQCFVSGAPSKPLKAARTRAPYKIEPSRTYHPSFQPPSKWCPWKVTSTCYKSLLGKCSQFITPLCLQL